MSGSSPPPLPDDPGVPASRRLFDARHVGELIGPATGHRRVDRLRWRYLAGVPGESYTIRYEVTTELGVSDLAIEARGANTEVFVHPDDPRLPALGDIAGLATFAGQGGVEPHHLAWVPGERATLRFGSAVVKVYAASSDAVIAHDRMHRVRGAVATSEPIALDEHRAATVQAALVGRTLERRDAAPWASTAIGILEQLQDAQFDGLALFGPREVLQLASAPVGLVSFCRPELGDRLQELADHLRINAPTPATPVVAHGDFNVGQLIVTGATSLAVVDVDTLCLASPSLDIAGYATNLVSGRPDDLTDALLLLEQISHHTDTTDDLDWYVAAAVLRRVDRAIRRVKRDWPERTQRLVEAAEAAVARV